MHAGCEGTLVGSEVVLTWSIPPGANMTAASTRRLCPSNSRLLRDACVPGSST